LSEQQEQQMRLQTTSKEEFARLLELRRLKKERTPKFQRQESWRYIRVHEPWRKPKGVDSHMRLSVKGWPGLVKVGYRVPKLVRGLHPSGYRDVLVHNLAELERLSRETDAARLAAGVGRRKRIEIAKRAKELGIRVLNSRGLLAGQRITGSITGEGGEVEEIKEEEEQRPQASSTKPESKEISTPRRQRTKRRKQGKKPKSTAKKKKRKSSGRSSSSAGKKSKKKKSGD
jgi:large subunit ribosomal protein L32e